ncbi:hypothetical protein B0H14DRAFT_2555162 [Mycena olivaceomarginata]|nr:hypothetical protein B0H14DRAFT_2555162 [Mycena olivaceomarginata]
MGTKRIHIGSSQERVGSGVSSARQDQDSPRTRFYFRVFDMPLLWTVESKTGVESVEISRQKVKFAGEATDRLDWISCPPNGCTRPWTLIVEDAVRRVFAGANSKKSVSVVQEPSEHLNLHQNMGGRMGIFGHLDADVVIKKIADIIMDNSVKPEQWAMTEEGFDQSWMPIEALREP